MYIKKLYKHNCVQFTNKLIFTKKKLLILCTPRTIDTRHYSSSTVLYNGHPVFYAALIAKQLNVSSDQSTRFALGCLVGIRYIGR